MAAVFENFLARHTELLIEQIVQPIRNITAQNLVIRQKGRKIPFSHPIHSIMFFGKTPITRPKKQVFVTKTAKTGANFSLF